MENNNAANVTVGKPKIGGAIFRAPVGTTLPTDAKAALSQAFVNLGYISEDGVANDYSMETSEIKAWGGDTVNSAQTGQTDTWKYTLIEAVNAEALKEVYGDDNVSGTIATGLTVKANSKERAPHCYVVDMTLKGNILKRVVIPYGKLSALGEIAYKDDTAVGFETTITAFPDDNGNTHYEYLVKGGESE